LTHIKVRRPDTVQPDAMATRIIHILLVAAITLSMFGAALAQGLVHADQPAAGPYQQVVICAEGAERVVFLDARGDPVEPDASCVARLCPDCLAFASADLATRAGAPSRADPPTAVATPHPDLSLPTRHAAHEAARGPSSKT